MSVPELKTLLTIHLNVEEPKQIYTTPQGSLTSVVIKNGIIKSTDPDNYPFEASISYGYDDLTTKDGEVINLDCKLYGETVNGSGLLLSYYGVVVPNESVKNVLGKKSSTMEIEDGYVTCNPVFKLDAKAEKESWVYKKNFVGKGRFIRDESGGLIVQYNVYALE